MQMIEAVVAEDFQKSEVALHFRSNYLTKDGRNNLLGLLSVNSTKSNDYLKQFASVPAVDEAERHYLPTDFDNEFDGAAIAGDEMKTMSIVFIDQLDEAQAPSRSYGGYFR